jgi:hypothetical protein
MHIKNYLRLNKAIIPFIRNYTSSSQSSFDRLSTLEKQMAELQKKYIGLQGECMGLETTNERLDDELKRLKHVVIDSASMNGKLYLERNLKTYEVWPSTFYEEFLSNPIESEYVMNINTSKKQRSKNKRLFLTVGITASMVCILIVLASCLNNRLTSKPKNEIKV